MPTRKKATKKKPSKKKQIPLSEQVAAEVKKQMPRIEAGINVVTPNTIHLKMQAICDTAFAVRKLAEAINSVNVEVTIANNVAYNCERVVNLESV